MPLRVPDSLARHLTQGRCTLFVGAGLSMTAGLPGWVQLLREMLEELKRESSDSNNDEEWREVHRLIESGRLLEVADHCRRRLGERLYREFLGSRLRGGKGQIPEVHKLIAQLPFREVVTTNYDKLLERAYAAHREESPQVVTSAGASNLGSLLFNGDFFILKAHGDIDDAASLVLTAHDYRRVMHSNPAFDAFFSALLLTRSVLFLGYSLGDPDFRLLMERQLAVFGDNVPERYAVMSGVGSVEKEGLLRSANIRVLSYQEGQHQEVVDFVEALKVAIIDPRARNFLNTQDSSSSPRAVPTLHQRAEARASTSH